MTVQNKQKAIADTFNNAFASKQADNTLLGDLILNKEINGNSANVQVKVNEHVTKISALEAVLDFDAKDEKEIPVEDDIVLIEDSEDSNSKKKVKLSNLLGGGGGGGGSTAWIDGEIAPYKSIVSGLEVYSFDSESAQELFLNVVVPESYAPGTQIKLKNAKVFINNNADNALIRCETTLIKNGAPYTDETNQHVSANSELDLSLNDVNDILSVGEIDLSDATGLVNLVAIAAGDLLKIRLYRDFANESSSASEELKFLKYSAGVSFS